MISLAIAIAMSQTSEALRPQYHFTAQKGWLNDPNGLVYYKGEYHLFFQHNPFGTEWGNMTWGHAVSKDLLHWKQLPNALEPDAMGTMFSGSAVVDTANTSGFGANAMVMLYTSAGGTNEASKGQPFTQGLAYSTDGRTFTKFTGNPILKHIEAENRDPKVNWHEPSKSWIMVLYLNGDRYGIFRSSDLKTWTRTDEIAIPGSSECPDLFELPIDGDPKVKKWVFWGADGKYRLGSFDGFKFKAETPPMDSTAGANDYAAQTFSDEPKGRRIQISWMRGGSYPGAPFNQQMSVPRELTLRSTPGGPKISTKPVQELETLRQRKAFEGERLQGRKVIPVKTGLLEVRFRLNLHQKTSLAFGELPPLQYDPTTQDFSYNGRSIKLFRGVDELDVIVYLDRTSIEIFLDYDVSSMPFCFVPKSEVNQIVVESDGLPWLQVYELKSTYPAK